MIGWAPASLAPSTTPRPMPPQPMMTTRLADLTRAIIVDDAETGRERIGQQGANLEIRVGGNGGEAVFRNNGVTVESGDETRAGFFAIPIVSRRTALRCPCPDANGAPRGRRV